MEITSLRTIRLAPPLPEGDVAREIGWRYAGTGFRTSAEERRSGISGETVVGSLRSGGGVLPAYSFT